MQLTSLVCKYYFILLKLVTSHRVIFYGAGREGIGEENNYSLEAARCVRFFDLGEPSASLNFPRSGTTYREFHNALKLKTSAKF